MKWILKDTSADRPGIIGLMTTFVFFIVGSAVGVAVYPFANFYLINNTLPDSTETSDIFSSLRGNVWAIVLSSVVGGFLALVSIFSLRFGRFIGTFITLLEQIIIYSALYYFAIWIMWKTNENPGVVIFTMLPYFIYMLAAVFTLEIAAIFGQSGRIAYNFVCLGTILGSFIGILRSVDLSYFPAVSQITVNKALGIAFARSAVDTCFFFGACALASACIARSKIGGSILWHMAALVLPVGLACAFATSSEIADQLGAIIASETARWIVAVLIAVIANLFAFAVFRPIRKQSIVSTNKNSTGRNVRPAAVQGRVVASGPIAANAVVLV